MKQYVKTDRKSAGPIPPITVHVEPESQGGATYYKCEECGREAMRRRDLRSDAHRAECRREGSRPSQGSRDSPASHPAGEAVEDSPEDPAEAPAAAPTSRVIGR